MGSGNKIWSTAVDYFLVLGAVIGVGFASGKDIFVFFFSFGQGSILGLVSLGLLYIYLFFVIEYISKKLEINSYNEFNAKLFGKFCKITNVVLIINFTITSAGMLAGADYLFNTFFGIGYKIPSIIICIFGYFLLMGGIKRIKNISNIIIPLMVAIITINSIKNITPNNVNFVLTKENNMIAVYYALLFAVNNFVAALPILFQTRLKTKGKLCVVATICMVILLNILVLSSQNFSTEMPMLELSKNVSNSFYYVYFITIIFAVVSTFIISCFNCQQILSKNKSSKFVSLVVIITAMIISNFGYNFIVKYLYVLSGAISGLYVILILILIAVKLIRYKSNKKQ